MRHPSDAVLLGYAGGTLPQALGLVVAAHLSFCARCRAAKRDAEAAGGALLTDLPPAAMAPGALGAALARLTGAVEAPPPPRMPNSGLPPPLDRCEMGRWWTLLPGIRFRRIKTAGRGWAGLLAAAPGRSLPAHAHAGLELTCVLRGGFEDAWGHYDVGDLAEPEGDHDIPPRADAAEGCVCVLASEGPPLPFPLTAFRRRR